MLRMMISVWLYRRYGLGTVFHYESNWHNMQTIVINNNSEVCDASVT